MSKSESTLFNSAYNAGAAAGLLVGAALSAADAPGWLMALLGLGFALAAFAAGWRWAKGEP